MSKIFKVLIDNVEHSFDGKFSSSGDGIELVRVKPHPFKNDNYYDIYHEEIDGETKTYNLKFLANNCTPEHLILCSCNTKRKIYKGQL